MKHDTEFVIKSNESLPENKIKNETEQLLLKYKDGTNIHEHGKQKQMGQRQRLDLRSPKQRLD